MKKKLLLVGLMVILAVGAAFAEHPGGWGIGVMGQYNFVWDGFGGNAGAALSLKAPQLPVFWGINVDIYSNAFGIGVTGDHYFIDQTLVSDINLGWYLGLGGYGSLLITDSYSSLRLGARVPIGIYIIPIEFLEVFIDVAPSLGLGINFGDNVDLLHFPAGGLGLDIGLRFWI